MTDLQDEGGRHRSRTNGAHAAVRQMSDAEMKGIETKGVGNFTFDAVKAKEYQLPELTGQRTIDGFGSYSTALPAKNGAIEKAIPRKIEKIKFGIMDSVEIIKSAEFQVHERSLYKMPDRVPSHGGVLDPRLGVSNKNQKCQTCHQKLKECTGHFGYIKLELPVFHIGYFRSTLQILQCICKTCARVLLTDKDRRLTAKKFRLPNMERVRRENLFKGVLDKCKRAKSCPHCGQRNGPVKKAPSSLKLIHDQFNKDEQLMEEYHREFQQARKANSQLTDQNMKSAMDDLNPLRVQGLFKAIPDEDCELLDLAGRPENLLVTAIPVPPVCIRPSVEMDAGAGSNEDDLTVKLMQIVEVNNILRQGLEKGLPISNIAENWDFLQVQCAVYINSDLPGVTSMYQVPGKPTRGFVQRLKGKQGRFRGNLSGKRVDFSGRTVISPDPTLGVEEVGVPRQMAMMLTYPEKVTRNNIEKLRELVINGNNEYPGATFVYWNQENCNRAQQGQDSKPLPEKTMLKYGSRESRERNFANRLDIGDVVERHLEDGDIVLFNRQPSLHRLSIMAHRVKVLDGRTLRFNECVCAPYNADFDGDEMNLHVPQTEEARAEARELLGVAQNLSTPKNGEILVAATQDFLTCAFLLTSKDVFLTRQDVCRLASYFTGIQHVDEFRLDLPPPALVKPMTMWTGKQMFSLLLKPSLTDSTAVTLETKERIFGSFSSKKRSKPKIKRAKTSEDEDGGADALGPEPCMDLADGWVIFRSSELICGRLGKTTLGGGSKTGIFQVLSTDYGPASAVTVMNRLARLSAKMIGERGFSIGIDDVTPAEVLLKEKSVAISKHYDEVQEQIRQFHRGELERAAGCDLDTTLENTVTGALNQIRQEAASVCMKSLHACNSPLIMSQCGSKGSPINIAQMVACVGQQSVGGARAPNGFRDRTLPHFPRNDKSPEGKGFVANSFYSGLDPAEFFFHTMAGREGLVDTAVKTAETGYMSRRLMKALEDLYVHYDGSVRNAANAIMQIQYGDDSLDPVAMEGSDGLPVDFDRLFTLTSSSAYLEHLNNTICKDGGSKPGGLDLDDTDVLLPAEYEKAVQEEVKAHFDLLDESYFNQDVPRGKKAIKKKIRSLRDPGMKPLDGPLRCSRDFHMKLMGFLAQVGERLRDTRRRVKLPQDTRGDQVYEKLLKPVGFTRPQLQAFIMMCQKRHREKIVDPGSTVGAFGAQSIGEPGTQMTLKTFHFAGVASMNVTLGVPRIKEIINASRNIATPMIYAELEKDPNLGGHNQREDFEQAKSRARGVKMQLEKTTLGEVAELIRAEWVASDNNNSAVMKVKLDEKRLYDLQINDKEVRNVETGEIIKPARIQLNADAVRYMLADAPKIKVKVDQTMTDPTCPWSLEIDPVSKRDSRGGDKGRLNDVDVTIENLKAAVPSLVVAGIPTITKATIAHPEDDPRLNFEDPLVVIIVEGTGLLDVMGAHNVKGTTVVSNNIMEVVAVLGIEAARKTIIQEIQYTMQQHGMSIDDRHTMLLADCMTNRGEVLGITRFGIAKMKESVLMLASFEKTTDHLFDAALHGREDLITGVSESIIMGIPMPTGTGMFKLVQTPNGPHPDGPMLGELHGNRYDHFHGVLD